MASKALAYQVRPSKTSKAFWEAMGKVQSHLTDAKKIAAYNARKEQKMKVCWMGRGWAGGRDARMGSSDRPPTHRAPPDPLRPTPHRPLPPTC